MQIQEEYLQTKSKQIKEQDITIREEEKSKNQNRIENTKTTIQITKTQLNLLIIFNHTQVSQSLKVNKTWSILDHLYNKKTQLQPQAGTNTQDT